MPNNFIVLMVTSVYHPEVSGAANQCRQLVNTLRDKASFKVLTTTRDPDLSLRSKVDGVDVFRVSLKKKGVGSYCKAILKFTTMFLSERKDFQIVHLHGYSLKSVFLTILAKIYDKKVIIKMTSIGHDDPLAIRERGFLLSYFFSKADTYVGISPYFEMLYKQSKLPLDHLIHIPNGVDTNRFCPVSFEKKSILRDQLGLPQKMKLILFVGHFSREKSPDILLDAWMMYVSRTFPDSGIVFIGSTNPDHYEVNAELVKDIKETSYPHINKRIFFIERTQSIEKVYKTVNIFVLPSLREGLPNSLLEAMACGLPVVSTKINGVTDWVVTDGINGLLVEPGIRDDLGKAIKRILSDAVLAESLGLQARETILDNFSINKVAESYLQLYSEFVN